MVLCFKGDIIDILSEHNIAQVFISTRYAQLFDLFCFSDWGSTHQRRNDRLFGLDDAWLRMLQQCSTVAGYVNVSVTTQCEERLEMLLQKYKMYNGGQSCFESKIHLRDTVNKELYKKKRKINEM